MPRFVFLLIVSCLISTQFNVAYTVCQTFMGSERTKECPIKKTCAPSRDDCQRMCELGTEDLPAVVEDRPVIFLEDYSVHLPQCGVGSAMCTVVAEANIRQLGLSPPQHGAEVYLLNASFLI